MIDIDTLYRALGATQSLGADEQLMLDDQVRVSCAQDAVTAIFESLNATEERLDALFEICRLQGGVLPFTTRSGHMAVRLSSESPTDETPSLLQRLRAVMAHLEVGPPQEPA
jgi:hypothetical protein